MQVRKFLPFCPAEQPRADSLQNRKVSVSAKKCQEMQLIEIVASPSTKIHHAFSHFCCCKNTVKVTVKKYNWTSYLLPTATNAVIEQNKTKQSKQKPTVSNFHFPPLLGSSNTQWHSSHILLSDFRTVLPAEISGKCPRTLKLF